MNIFYTIPVANNLENRTVKGFYANNEELSEVENNKIDEIKRYDFKSIDRSNLLDTVNTLIKGGLMSLDESTYLIALDINGRFPIESGGNILGQKNEVSNQSIDLFSALNQAISYNLSIKNFSGVDYAQKALNALERIQGAVSSIDIKI